MDIIYTDDLRKQMADIVTELQVKDGYTLAEISNDIYGDDGRMMEVFKSFDDIRYLQNELNRRVMVEVDD